MKFRFKLTLSYFFLAALIAASFYLYFNHFLQKSMIEESRTNLLSQTQLASMLVIGDKKTTPPQKLAEAIDGAIKARVTLISADGTVTGDSDVGRNRLTQLDNHLKRPEVQEAAKNGSGSSLRYSDTLRVTMLYTAMPTGNNGFIRLAMPLEYLSSTRKSLHGMLGGATLLTILVALFFSYILSNLISRPLRAMADAASQIGKGNNFVRIPVLSKDENGTLATVLNEMAERLEDQVQILSGEKQRLDTILRSMGEGVMVATTDGSISLVNPAFHKLFSITGAVEGGRLIEISRHPALYEAFTELNKPGQHELLKEIVIQPQNLTLLTHWVPLNVHGVKQGIVAVFHDISELKQVENMRRDFVANVSHELRTPVTIIKGYAETLLDGDILGKEPEHARRFVEIIASHSERLTSLINDILTLSSLETKDTTLELSPLDVSETISKVCMLLQDKSAEKRLVIINEASRGGVPRLMADNGRLEQVLLNLLENAIKYTNEAGTIRIFTEENGEFVKISIADTGIGIPFKDLPRIFERFYRVDEARTREQGGTGLGLSIVKHIVQLHGGEVSVTSEQGKGSIFSFTLKKG